MLKVRVSGCSVITTGGMLPPAVAEEPIMLLELPPIPPRPPIASARCLGSVFELRSRSAVALNCAFGRKSAAATRVRARDSSMRATAWRKS